MSYQLKDITIRTDNSKEGMDKVNELWKDIVNGKIPLMYDSDRKFLQGLSPVSAYRNYESNETGAFDLKIFTVTADFFTAMEKQICEGKYKKYDFDGVDIQQATYKAWAQVWEEQGTQVIRRSFTEDFESTVPAEYTKDGKAHCYLYIAVK